MSFIDWFKLGMDTNKKVKVAKLKKESIAPGEMASGSPTAAAEALA